MTFLSYAQNYEDLMLFRALRNVQDGFYIDVGAQDPIEDSVTKAFYERGWRGINIDPAEHWYRKLQEDRPRDINLCVAASDHRGTLHFYDVAETGLSTSSEDFARQHKQAGRRIAEYEIECRTLDEICEEYRVDVIHFLKIDAEGAEGSVLRGLSLDRIRPWIIVIEAMLPNSQVPAWQEWHPLLDKHGYACIYEDGLNRFYLAAEHLDLKEAFRFPPNILDDFVQRRTEAAMDFLRTENERRENALGELRSALQRSFANQDTLAAELISLRRALHASEAEASRLRVEASRLGDELAVRVAEIDSMHGEMVSLGAALVSQREEIAVRDQIIASSTETIRAMRDSTSWRVTAPLRWMGTAAGSSRRVAGRALVSALRPPARFARPALRRLAQIGWLRACVARLLGSESRIAVRARWFLFGPQNPVTSPKSVSRTQLTRSALRVLGEIDKRRHVGRRKRGGRG